LDKNWVPQIILVGCVSLKRSYVSPARDLYISPLWEGRRAYAEERGCPWYILSAKYGLLAPDDEIEPYDLKLDELPVDERCEWSQQVFDKLESNESVLQGKTIEIHAGKPYVEYLEPRLREAGATICRPLAHISGIGRQISWYKKS